MNLKIVVKLGSPNGAETQKTFYIPNAEGSDLTLFQYKEKNHLKFKHFHGDLGVRKWLSSVLDIDIPQITCVKHVMFDKQIGFMDTFLTHVELYFSNENQYKVWDRKHKIKIILNDSYASSEENLN